MGIAIVGSGSYLPDKVLTNTDLVETLGVNEQWIVERTGIKERHIAAPGEANSDLATHAARRALDSAGLTPFDIDLIVVASTNPDQPMPATACFVQANLGASRSVAFDVAAACSGFVFALAAAHDMLAANRKRTTALVIGAEVISRFIDYNDRRTAVLFGDGAGAVVLRKSEQLLGILTTNIGSDGTLADLAYVSAGGTRYPASSETLAARDHFMKMRGGGIRRTVTGILPEMTSEILGSVGKAISDVHLIVPHQMNGVMLREWPHVLNISPQLIYQTIAWSGNTGAASIPIALDDAVHSGSLSDDDLVLLLAFGAGLTWGGAALRWHDFRSHGQRGN